MHVPELGKEGGAFSLDCLKLESYLVYVID